MRDLSQTSVAIPRGAETPKKQTQKKEGEERGRAGGEGPLLGARRDPHPWGYRLPICGPRLFSLPLEVSLPLPSPSPSATLSSPPPGPRDLFSNLIRSRNHGDGDGDGGQEHLREARSTPRSSGSAYSALPPAQCKEHPRRHDGRGFVLLLRGGCRTHDDGTGTVMLVSSARIYVWTDGMGRRFLFKLCFVP